MDNDGLAAVFNAFSGGAADALNIYNNNKARQKDQRFKERAFNETVRQNDERLRLTEQNQNLDYAKFASDNAYRDKVYDWKREEYDRGLKKQRYANIQGKALETANKVGAQDMEDFMLNYEESLPTWDLLGKELFVNELDGVKNSRAEWDAETNLLTYQIDRDGDGQFEGLVSLPRDKMRHEFNKHQAKEGLPDFMVEQGAKFVRNEAGQLVLVSTDGKPFSKEKQQGLAAHDQELRKSTGGMGLAEIFEADDPLVHLKKYFGEQKKGNEPPPYLTGKVPPVEKGLGEAYPDKPATKEEKPLTGHALTESQYLERFKRIDNKTGLNDLEKGLQHTGSYGRYLGETVVDAGKGAASLVTDGLFGNLMKGASNEPEDGKKPLSYGSTVVNPDGKKERLSTPSAIDENGGYTTSGVTTTKGSYGSKAEQFVAGLGKVDPTKAKEARTLIGAWSMMEGGKDAVKNKLFQDLMAMGGGGGATSKKTLELMKGLVDLETAYQNLDEKGKKSHRDNQKGLADIGTAWAKQFGNDTSKNSKYGMSNFQGPESMGAYVLNSLQANVKQLHDDGWPTTSISYRVPDGEGGYNTRTQLTLDSSKLTVGDINRMYNYYVEDNAKAQGTRPGIGPFKGDPRDKRGQTHDKNPRNNPTPLESYQGASAEQKKAIQQETGKSEDQIIEELYKLSR